MTRDETLQGIGFVKYNEIGSWKGHAKILATAVDLNVATFKISHKINIEANNYKPYVDFIINCFAAEAELIRQAILLALRKTAIPKS